MIDQFTIRALAPQEARGQVGALSDVLIDCVEGGASVSFMLPLTRDRADAFWHGVAEGAIAGERILLVGAGSDERTGGGHRAGHPETAGEPAAPGRHREDARPSRAPEARHRRAPSCVAAEEAARKAGKTVLVLDTVTGGDAERLYERVGWTKSGIIPNYALWPQGGFCDTTVFYKLLAAA